MTDLRFQTGEGHQTSPASLRGNNHVRTYGNKGNEYSETKPVLKSVCHVQVKVSLRGLWLQPNRRLVRLATGSVDQHAPVLTRELGPTPHHWIQYE